MREVQKNSLESNSRSRFPQTIVAVSREEFYDNPLQLTVRDGKTDQETKLPDDLQGHFFTIGPCGSVASSPVQFSDDEKIVWTAKDGWTALYNGDGMVYRLSFANGGASLKTRLVETPCYHADKATSEQNNQEQYGELAFQDLGITRLSLNKLGMRNQLNTALAVFKSELDNHKSDRLLVTWDVGRPYEIDPETLETLTPVGKNKDWEEVLPAKISQIFKQLMTSAHPAVDPETQEVFIPNVGKSVWTILGLARSVQERVAENANKIKTVIQKSSPSLQDSLLRLYGLFLKLLQTVIKIVIWIDKISKRIGSHDFVHLLLWDGKQVDAVQKWNVVLPNKRQIKIDQTVHQMGITKDYIVLAETSFKFSLENILPYQKDNLATDLKILLADFIDYPQLPYTKLYIIKRTDLKQAAQKKTTNKLFSGLFGNKTDQLPTVTAQEVILEPEFSHYLVDYDNPNGQITLHVAHLAATDIAEYIRVFDRSVFDDRDRDDTYDDPELTYRLQKLAGNVVSPTDVSRIGCWVIDGNTGQIITKKLVSDERLTWSTAFYIYQDKRPTQKFTDIFWNSWGCWPDTLTTRIVEAYRKYAAREIPVDRMLELTYQGVPSSICHLKIDKQTAEDSAEVNLEITDDYYQFDNHYLGTSSQFVPRPNAQDQTDGYIVSIVLTSDEFLSQSKGEDNDPEWSQNTEIWIFDARNLSQGPLYKLSHPKLNIGFTIHTVWIKEAVSPPRLKYNVREDHNYLINQQNSEVRDTIQKLFDREIYPKFQQNS